MTDIVRCTAEHWDRAYTDSDHHSWDQTHANTSIAMLERVGLSHAERVVDVGGGTSPLVEELLSRAVPDVTVLDVSAAALAATQQRLGVDAIRVHWLHQDLLEWAPQRRYTHWHDRAVLHFLTDADDIARYRRVLLAATAPGSSIVIATFAPHGPDRCSGLPVARYSADQLADTLALDADIVHGSIEDHHTPTGAIQPFTWLALRRRS